VNVMSELYSQTDDMINAYKILVVKRGGKRPLGIPRLDMKIILKNDIGYNAEDRIDLVQVRVQWWVSVNMSSIFTNFRDFLTR